MSKLDFNDEDNISNSDGHGFYLDGAGSLTLGNKDNYLKWDSTLSLLDIKGDIGGEIGEINIGNGTIVIDGINGILAKNASAETTFQLDLGGDAFFKGNIESDTGNIGGWFIDSNAIFIGDKLENDVYGNSETFTISSEGYMAGNNFKITNGGVATFNNLVASGDFNLGGGNVTNKTSELLSTNLNLTENSSYTANILNFYDTKIRMLRSLDWNSYSVNTGSYVSYIKVTITDFQWKTTDDKTNFVGFILRSNKGDYRINLTNNGTIIVPIEDDSETYQLWWAHIQGSGIEIDDNFKDYATFSLEIEFIENSTQIKNLENPQEDSRDAISLEYLNTYMSEWLTNNFFSQSGTSLADIYFSPQGSGSWEYLHKYKMGPFIFYKGRIEITNPQAKVTIVLKESLTRPEIYTSGALDEQNGISGVSVFYAQAKNKYSTDTFYIIADYTGDTDGNTDYCNFLILGEE
jgi:hypothetical protein